MAKTIYINIVGAKTKVEYLKTMKPKWASIGLTLISKEDLNYMSEFTSIFVHICQIY